MRTWGGKIENYFEVTGLGCIIAFDEFYISYLLQWSLVIQRQVGQRQDSSFVICYPNKYLNSYLPSITLGTKETQYKNK